MMRDWGPFWMAGLVAAGTTLIAEGNIVIFFLLWILFLIVAWRLVPR